MLTYMFSSAPTYTSKQVDVDYKPQFFPISLKIVADEKIGSDYSDVSINGCK